MDPEPIPSKRIQLQSLLESLLGNSNVYFQPPSNVQMKFPAITFHLDDEKVLHAGNAVYHLTKRYQVTHITDDPDSDVLDKIAALPMCSFDRFYPAENLNHYVYNLYF